MVERRNIVLSDHDSNNDAVLCVFQPEMEKIIDSEGREVHLNPTEVFLLEALVGKRGKNIPNFDLAPERWTGLGTNVEGPLECLRVNLSRLKGKLKLIGMESYLRNEPGRGYVWEGDNYQTTLVHFIPPRSSQQLQQEHRPKNSDLLQRQK